MQVANRQQSNYLISFTIYSFITVIISYFGIQAWLVQSFNLLNWDVAWLLYTANEWINGSTLYIDNKENNPPLIIYIYSIAAYFSSLVSIDMISSIRLQMLALIAIYMISAYSMITRYELVQSKIQKILLIGLTAWLMFFLFADSFGQREHILTLLFLPYLINCSARLMGNMPSKLLSLFSAISVAIAVSIKPYFLVILIFIELALIIKSKKLKPIFRLEAITIALTGSLYLAIVYTHVPQYINEIIPFALSVYWGMKEPFVDILLHDHHLTNGIITSTTAIIYLTVRPNSSAFLLPWLLATMGAFCGYLLGGTTWAYHLLPYLVFKAILIGLLALSFINELVLEKDSPKSLTKTQKKMISLTMTVLLSLSFFFLELFAYTYITTFLLAALLFIEKFNLPKSKMKMAQIAIGFSFFCTLFHFHNFKSYKPPKHYNFTSLTTLFDSRSYSLSPRDTLINSSDTLLKPVNTIFNLIEKYSTPEDTVYIMAVNIKPSFPIINYIDRKWPTRYQSLWPLPALTKMKAGNNPKGLEKSTIFELDKKFKQDITEDLEKNLPKLILVSNRKVQTHFDAPINFVEYFSENDRFAQLMQNYKKMDAAEGQPAFDLYIKTNNI